MSRISVALCTYNGAKFLSEQLESFLAQTRPPDEIVVGDDRSTDETIKIIEEFARRAAFPVRIHVNEKNLGSTKNFERTIARCAGEIIFLSDQDDVWLPQKIARMEKEFADEKVGLVFSDAILTDENRRPLGEKLFDFTFPEKLRREARRGADFVEILLRQNVVTGAAAAFRAEFRKFFAPIPGDIPNSIHDGWIALTIASRAKLEFIEEPLIEYRQHSNQQLGVNWESRQTKNHEERRIIYDKSIDYHQSEITRLRRVKEIFAGSENSALKNKDHLIDELINEKTQIVAHYELRKRLPPNRLKRFLPVAGEFFSGRYGRFSKGILSATKDLLEKW